ncbi:unnamed protein product [Cylicostephanus goldi]|uniref:Uncharacterized protein n=1 Tax=Cylicostephanus goldi TaxID=71465 RepID=A0A3P7NAH3_CYLGO|nr:unnamed protein product [Cylicostephanus goldi]
MGADRIYAGQMAVLSGSPLGSVIKKMWDEEREHLDIMERLAARHGIGTALMGKEAAMACTVAVEEVIGRHYNRQIEAKATHSRRSCLSHVDHVQKFHNPFFKGRDFYPGEGSRTSVPVSLYLKQTYLAPAYDVLKWVIQTGCKGAIAIAEKI